MDETADALDEMISLVVRHLSDRASLSMTALACLARLHHEGALRLTTLATAEGVSQPSMSQLVQRLERQGLVTRISDPEDGRASLVALTDPGRTLLADRRRDRHERLAELLATLPAEDAATLRLAMNVALPVVRRLVDAARDPSPATAKA
ncbi:MarR family transcriptional regulator [Amycolatopsis sp. OK19-0408]|uniref:MarR family transcriptional regulator n=1 Tax=Amycolatopsis iheyensis TaxID=2945988 RepID=A0A9X2N5S6_9PSEU|nr:MarR family transcriptional regulator [Amycolatopsis iheyensis]MCR6482836.1 MarR family transcriptional regulator [Amycolatopsis iheyensis]